MDACVYISWDLEIGESNTQTIYLNYHTHSMYNHSKHWETFASSNECHNSNVCFSFHRRRNSFRVRAENTIFESIGDWSIWPTTLIIQQIGNKFTNILDLIGIFLTLPSLATIAGIIIVVMIVVMLSLLLISTYICIHILWTTHQNRICCEIPTIRILFRFELNRFDSFCFNWKSELYSQSNHLKMHSTLAKQTMKWIVIHRKTNWIIILFWFFFFFRKKNRLTNYT